MKTLGSHAEHGAKTALDVFSVENYLNTYILLSSLIPDFPTAHPIVSPRDLTGKREQLAHISLTAITDALAQRTGIPFSDALLLARLKHLKTPTLDNFPTAAAQKNHAIDLMGLIQTAMTTFADPPTLKSYSNKDVTDWFISKWPRYFTEPLTNWAEKCNFALLTFSNAIIAYEEKSSEIDRVYDMMNTASNAHKLQINKPDKKNKLGGNDDKRQGRNAPGHLPQKSRYSKNVKGSGSYGLKKRFNLPDTANDLPEELKRDTNLCKVYNETNAFSKNVCFTCGSNDHHTKGCQNSSPTSVEKAKGDKFAKAYAKLLEHFNPNSS